MELTHEERYAMETPESIEQAVRMAHLEEQEFELNERIEHYNKETKEKNTQIYQAIADKYKVGDYGFNSDRPFVVNMDKLQHVACLIHESFRIAPQGSRKHVHNSYSLKHFAEQVLGPRVNHYVSNAELIVCMIEQGFEPSRISKHNCVFKVDIESDFAKGFKKAQTIWKKYITPKNTYEDMDDKDGQFSFDYATDSPLGFDPYYDLYLRGYLHAKHMTHYHYPNLYADRSPLKYPLSTHLYFKGYYNM
jgi:hypothetical protein